MTTVSAPGAATAAPPMSTERKKLHEAAQAFEAIFVRQVLSSARQANFGNDLLGNDKGNETFTQMRDERFAEIASKSGAFGLAAQIEAQLTRTLAPTAPAAAQAAATAKKD